MSICNLEISLEYSKQCLLKTSLVFNYYHSSSPLICLIGSQILILRQGIVERVYERQRGKEKERFLIRKKIDAKFVELLSISHKCPQLSSSQSKNLENGLNAISNTSLYQWIAYYIKLKMMRLEHAIKVMLTVYRYATFIWLIKMPRLCMLKFWILSDYYFSCIGFYFSTFPTISQIFQNKVLSKSTELK